MKPMPTRTPGQPPAKMPPHDDATAPPHAEPDGDEATVPEADEMMEAERNATQTAVEAMAGPPPAPANMIQVSAVESLVDSINKVMSVMSPGANPVTYKAPDHMPSTKEPIPSDAWNLLYTLGESLKMLAAMPDGQVLAVYTFDPKEAATRQPAMQDAAGKLNTLSRDKKALGFIEQQVKAAAEDATNKQAQANSSNASGAPMPNGNPSTPAM